MLIRLFILGLLTAGITTCTACFNGNPGTGDRVGQVVFLHQEGIRANCQTWEAQLLRGGMIGGSGTFGSPFNFTIEEKTGLLDQVRQYMESGTEVIATVRIEGVFDFCRTGSHGHFLEAIRPAHKLKTLYLVPNSGELPNVTN